eukprot:TRINITY_DN1977_c0_g6_i1.p1 TRINITY_DN1977_c0_g6~~TRINITY_DN1977_c0_g6_i1.p1  ORF type:complete len:439 (+),score=129.73 TRINITY_DN1977_c0_g6_i1:69-1385(+)
MAMRGAVAMALAVGTVVVLVVRVSLPEPAPERRSAGTAARQVGTLEHELAQVQQALEQKQRELDAARESAAAGYRSLDGERRRLRALEAEAEELRRRTPRPCPAQQSAESPPPAPAAGARFAPGSSGLRREEVFRRCSMHQPLSYREHQAGSTCGAFLMLNRHLAVFSAPKAGTSTARGLLEVVDGAECIQGPTRKCWAAHDDIGRLGPDITVAAMVRDPFARFLSQYEEMIARSWDGDYKTGLLKVPEGLHFRDGLHSYKEYSSRFDTPEGRAELTRRFETFVHEWDWRQVFDPHLVLQVPCFSWRRPPYETFPAAHISTPTREGTASLLKFLLQHSDPPSQGKGTSADGKPPDWLMRVGGRSFSRRMNTSAISPEAARKICRIAAIDFCCLDFPLPPLCVSAPEAGRVSCEWVRPPAERELPSEPRLLIEPRIGWG